MSDPELRGKPVGLEPLKRIEVTHDAPTQDIPEGFDIRRVKTNPPPDEDGFFAGLWARVTRMFRSR